jgi:hypothetical protein
VQQRAERGEAKAIAQAPLRDGIEREWLVIEQ